MADLTDEAKREIAEAVRIVREDKFAQYVRTGLPDWMKNAAPPVPPTPPPGPNPPPVPPTLPPGPTPPPPVPPTPPTPPEPVKKKGLWWPADE